MRAVHETIEAMEKIEESSRKVEELVSSINEIASQTNLLAINAAIEATKAGRRVEVSTARGVVEVTEVTRSGTAVRSGRFMAARVLALVEHPAPPAPRRARRARNQASLL